LPFHVLNGQTFQIRYAGISGGDGGEEQIKLVEVLVLTIGKDADRYLGDLIHVGHCGIDTLFAELLLVKRYEDGMLDYCQDLGWAAGKSHASQAPA